MSNREQQVLGLIKNAIKRKDPEAEIILYGSRARGEAGKESDWDILILLNHDNVTRSLEQEYRHQLFDVELEIGEPISTFVYSKKEWNDRFSVTPFYKSIQEEGKRL